MRPSVTEPVPDRLRNAGSGRERGETPGCAGDPGGDQPSTVYLTGITPEPVLAIAEKAAVDRSRQRPQT